MSHDFHFEGDFPFKPLDLLETTEVKPRKLENTRIERDGVTRLDKTIGR
jgi:hypothetical protein